ncbi:MAG: ferric reductase-like transmembrane domain-containing protein [Desulfobacterales bacterium]|nr:ferric reductase-like transmembrane domain-containing protein [Desulfobacterales bacterium]
MSLVQDVLSGGRHHYFTGEVYSGGGFMGVKMGATIKSYFFRQSMLVFSGMPVLIWAMGNLFERSLLKESLSVMTILAFYQLIGQFFWARTNRSIVAKLKMSKVINYHKIIGYTFVIILFFHPLYLVLPRFFESGVSPVDAFITIISTLNQGVVLGIMAWCLMLALGITSLARKKLPMKYTTWRFFHGLLAMLFISIAAWHAIDLGRHTDLAMSILISMLTAGGILLFLKTHTLKIFKKTSEV